jgi:aarF domain-containing kinase
MKRELADECDYVREAESGRKFAELLEGDEYFDVPKVVDEASTARVLTTTWMEGKPLSRMKNMSQETRDKVSISSLEHFLACHMALARLENCFDGILMKQIGTNILRLCLIELFQFRFMQTDPNWANFLYNASTDRLGLIDFGASREYTPHFMDAWHALLTAALEGDREGMREQSLRIGYFTGEEEEVRPRPLLSLLLLSIHLPVSVHITHSASSIDIAITIQRRTISLRS